MNFNPKKGVQVNHRVRVFYTCHLRTTQCFVELSTTRTISAAVKATNKNNISSSKSNQQEQYQQQ